MNKIIGIALAVTGLMLLLWGLDERNSLGSEIHEFFKNVPTDRAMWMMVGGAAGIIVGLGLVLLPARRVAHRA